MSFAREGRVGGYLGGGLEDGGLRSAFDEGFDGEHVTHGVESRQVLGASCVQRGPHQVQRPRLEICEFESAIVAAGQK